MLGPSESGAACSKPIPYGMCARAPCSRTQTSSAFAPPRRPKTRSPGANSVTAPPTASTTPASSMPTTRRFGRRSPVKAREKNGLAPRKPQSVRVTVDAWTRTRTSSELGTGGSSSSMCRTSGGPYLSWTTALTPSLPLALLSVDRRAVVPGRAGPVELRGPASGRAWLRLLPGRDHPALLRDHAPAEVRRVEAHAPDGLEHQSQLTEREGRLDERRRDARQLEVEPDPLDGVAHDLAVVERQLHLPVEHVRDGDDGGVRRVRPRDDRSHFAQHGAVRDRHDVHARVALGVAVG